MPEGIEPGGERERVSCGLLCGRRTEFPPTEVAISKLRSLSLRQIERPARDVKSGARWYSSATRQSPIEMPVSFSSLIFGALLAIALLILPGFTLLRLCEASRELDSFPRSRWHRHYDRAFLKAGFGRNDFSGWRKVLLP